jgi:hypothetical protein
MRPDYDTLVHMVMRALQGKGRLFRWGVGLKMVLGRGAPGARRLGRISVSGDIEEGCCRHRNGESEGAEVASAGLVEKPQISWPLVGMHRGV